MEKEIEALSTKAANATTGGEAMQFSQAAMNLAKAYRELTDVTLLKLKDD